MLTAPAVLAIARATATDVTSNSTVDYLLAFDQPVTNVSTNAFAVVMSAGFVDPPMISVSGNGANYMVSLSGVHGSGSLRLDLLDRDAIQNSAGERLGGLGAGNGNFSGETYLVDQQAPRVTAIDRLSPNAATTGASSVAYAVSFSEAVSGVDASDFHLALAGSLVASPLVSVAGSGASYTVTVSGIAGDGTLGLNLVDDGSILDLAGNGLMPPGSGPVSFAAQVTYATGLVPNSVAVADFNKDGRADLVVSNFLSNTAGVLLGNGDGTFAPQLTTPTQNGPVATAVGDVDGDGRDDLVVANFSSNSVSLLLGYGNGTFAPPVSWPVGVNPQSVALADVNNDGRLDILVANSGSNTVGVLLGNGNGTFQAQTTVAVGSKPNGLAVGDLNGDGLLDLVVANYTSNTVGVLLGNGNGTFQPQVALPALANPQSVALGDVNHDGKLDVVTANFGANSVSVFLGHGDGAFDAQASYAAGWKPQSAVLADVNQDGNPDIALVNFGNSNAGVLWGNGDGTFQPQTTMPTGVNPQSVAVADLNRDGKPDLVAANFLDSNVSVLLGNARGDFVGQTYTVHAATRLTFLAVPTQGTAGSPLGGPQGVRVAATDELGSTIVDSGVLVTLSIVGGTFADGGTSVVAPAVNGMATFASLVINAAGAYQLQASSGSLQAAVASVHVSSVVLARQLFYEGSTRYDVTNTQFPGYSNDNAIATDKVALQAGLGTATFANISSYSRGINGVMIDVLGLPLATTLAPTDFVFRVGNDNSPLSWALAPAPVSVTVRRGAGVSGSDRVELVWANNAIQKQWLQVTLTASLRTGLAIADVFYFGHALGDTGLGNSATQAIVSVTDELGARNHPQTLAANIPITNSYDFNRDGQVNTTDSLTARNNVTNLGTATRLINVDAFTGSAVVGRRLFYEHSMRYDVSNAQFPGNANDNAIAVDKVALMPGAGAATFANLSSYTLGINGIMVDLAGSGSHTGITAADFTFKLGNNNAPSTWASAPTPISVNVRMGAGSGGADRVELIWADGAIRNTWLQVTVLANARTGLFAPDVFYFGNAVGDTGLGDSATQANVSATDELAARNNPSSLFSNIPISNIYDFNRDGQVNASDSVTARNFVTSIGNVVRYISITNPPAAPESIPAATPSATAMAPAETAGPSRLAARLPAAIKHAEASPLSPEGVDAVIAHWLWHKRRK